MGLGTGGRKRAQPALLLGPHLTLTRRSLRASGQSNHSIRIRAANRHPARVAPLDPDSSRYPPMPQSTVVKKLTPSDGRQLEAALGAGPYEFRRVPHARFSAKGEGVVVTLYTSGKLVVQGSEAEGFCLRYLGGAAPSSEPRRERPVAQAAGWQPDVVATGSDEAGKGDVFGPLVVCALRLEPDEARKLAEGGVVDSKQLTDTKALELGAILEERYRPAVVRLDPIDYNPAHREHDSNLNLLLASLHARALRAAAGPGELVIVDQFGPEARMRDALAGSDFDLRQFPRGESVTCVAAASIVARRAFLLGLKELGDEVGVDLPKGAGSPVAGTLGRLLALHGPPVLKHVAKLHFKNVQRALR
jgi:ribonuclease HIII